MKKRIKNLENRITVCEGILIASLSSIFIGCYIESKMWMIVSVIVSIVVAYHGITLSNIREEIIEWYRCR